MSTYLFGHNLSFIYPTRMHMANYPYQLSFILFCYIIKNAYLCNVPNPLI